MNIAITGASGLIGTALVPRLESGGQQVIEFVRKSPGKGEANWDPARGEIDAQALAASDVVIHLAGDNIGEGRWTKAKKERIKQSRVAGTRLVLAEALAKLGDRPRTLICASAIGIYGNRGDELLDEKSAAGNDFLADVCQSWEAAAQPAREAGLRVVHLRFGMILARQGGALAKMLLPFKLGVGGVVGSGQQYWSWVTLDDAIGALQHAIATESLDGPVNIVAPQPVTNREFTKTLGRVLHRPTIFPMPGFAARLLLGEMADALLLAGQRVQPKRLEETGYAFQHPTLETALRAVFRPS